MRGAYSKIATRPALLTATERDALRDVISDILCRSENVWIEGHVDDLAAEIADALLAGDRCCAACGRRSPGDYCTLPDCPGAAS